MLEALFLAAEYFHAAYMIYDIHVLWKYIEVPLQIAFRDVMVCATFSSLGRNMRLRLR